MKLTMYKRSVSNIRTILQANDPFWDKKNYQWLCYDSFSSTCPIKNRLYFYIEIYTSYENGNSVVYYDKSKTYKEEIEKAILKTGYTILPVTEKHNQPKFTKK
jgi:hypothetical protein